MGGGLIGYRVSLHEAPDIPDVYVSHALITVLSRNHRVPAVEKKSD